MYSAASIGIEDYVSARKSLESKTSFDVSKFRSKMKQACDSNENLVFTDDLKQMAHIVNENEEDMLLMENMMIK